MSIETRFSSALAAGKINGAVLCATDAEGQFVYNNALGERTLLSGEKKPQQMDDVLCLGLASKLITTIAALQCVEDGLLTLQDELSPEIAPELSALQILSGFSSESKVPELKPKSGRITLEMLLTHSSGLAYYFLDPNITRWRKPQESSLNDSKQTVEETYNQPLSFEPGTGWMYGPGVDWAGRLVERVTGMSLGERMQKRIFDPLNISSAQFYPVSRDALRERMVDLNPKDPEGLGIAVLGGGGAMNKQSNGDFGGHGLFMTGVDFLKVLRSLLANDGKLLSPSTVDSMFSADHLSEAAAASHTKTLSSPPLGSFFGPNPDSLETKTSFGLGGLLVMQDLEGWYGQGTMTWGGGLTIVWFIDRKKGLCGLCAVQPSLPIGGSDRILGLKQTFCKDIYNKYGAWREKTKV